MLNITKKLTNECWKGKNTKRYIIVHHTGSKTGTTLTNMVKFFTRWDYISVHYIVGLKGEVVQTIREDDRAWHAGRSEWHGTKSLNNHSIGIEVVSDGYYYTDKQRQAVQELCRDIMGRNNIPIINVLRHADIAPRRKWDIGEGFYVKKWGSWDGFQTSLLSQGNDENIQRLEKMYHIQADVTSDDLAVLNNIKKELAQAKGVKYTPHEIT